MKTSHQLLWGLFGVIVISMMSLAIAMRLDLKESLPIHGNGQIQDSTIQVGPFSGMSVNNGMHVSYSPGEKHEVRIITDANLLDKVFVEERGGWLTISKDNDFGEASSLQLFVTSPSIEKIEVHNGASVSVDSVLNQEELEIEASNAGHIHLVAVTQSLELSATNSGSISLSGETTDLEASASSSGHIHAEDFLAQYADVSAEGSSSIKLRVSDRLVSSCNGSSSVQYHGPESLQLKSKGRIPPVAFAIEEQLPE